MTRCSLLPNSFVIIVTVIIVVIKIIVRLCYSDNIVFSAWTISTELLCFLFFSLFFVFGSCTRLSWSSCQLLSALI